MSQLEVERLCKLFKRLFRIVSYSCFIQEEGASTYRQTDIQLVDIDLHRCQNCQTQMITGDMGSETTASA